jgi:hypothetical protein
MEIEICNASVKAGVSESDARAAVESTNKEIDKRYALHAAQLFTKADGAELKADVIKWSITTIFAAVGLFAALTKIL